MKNRKGVSAWVKSFQMYSLARIEAAHQETIKGSQMPLPPQRASKMTSPMQSSQSEWITVGDMEPKPKSQGPMKSENKRPIEVTKTSMMVEHESQKMQELQTKIALLQRELNQHVYSEDQAQGSKDPSEPA
jgi:hypothetical protein